MNELPPQIQNNETSKTEIELLNEIEDLLDAKDLPRGPKHNDWHQRLDKGDLNKAELEALLSEIQLVRNKIKSIQEKPFSGHKKTEKIYDENISGLDEAIKNDSIAKIKAIAEEARQRKLEMLGYGMSAQVFISDKYPEYCYKIITNPEVYATGCDVRTETEFLCEMLDLEVDNVKIPKPYYYIMDDDVHMYVMENMRAVTLLEIERGEKSLPEKFDFDKFSQGLRDFFEALHQANIYHQDFHNKNLMIDENGLPCVIDPGRAKKQSLVGWDADPNINAKLKKMDIDDLERHFSVIKKLTNTI